MSDQIENAQIEYTVDECNDGIGEGHEKMPTGWFLYYAASVAWMFYYGYMYIPMFRGWTQTAGLE